MGTRSDDTTERLLVRAEAACGLLQAHLEDTGQTLYRGRAIAAQQITSNLLRDWRAHQAQLKEQARRRYAARRASMVHERAPR